MRVAPPFVLARTSLVSLAECLLLFHPISAGIMGASGCGKTSLLNMVAARIRSKGGVVSGSILFNGEGLPEQARRRPSAPSASPYSAPCYIIRQCLYMLATCRVSGSCVRVVQLCACARQASAETGS